MKKGFTLIEILAVVTIMGLIFVLAIPKIANSLRSKKTDIDKTTNDLILNAAKMYVNDNSSKFEKNDDAVYCLPFTTLTKDNYLDTKIQDVINDKDLTNSKSVKITYDKQFQYEIVDKKDCTVNNVSYKLIEYLESTGTQYIDTGLNIVNSQAIKYEGSLRYTTSGSRQLQGNIQGRYFGLNSNSKLEIGPNNTSDVDGLDWNDISFEHLNGVLRMTINNSITIQRDFSLNLVSKGIYLFALNSSNEIADYFCKERIKYFKIYVDDVLVRDYIPVLDKDNVPCLYDKIEKKFYYSKTDTEFIPGPLL